MKITRNARQTCRTQGTAPLVVYKDAVNQIPRLFENRQEQEQVELAMPSYKKIRTSLYRYVSKTF